MKHQVTPDIIPQTCTDPLCNNLDVGGLSQPAPNIGIKRRIQISLSEDAKPLVIMLGDLEILDVAVHVLLIPEPDVPVIPPVAHSADDSGFLVRHPEEQLHRKPAA